jgi:hypothetical protein
MAIANVTQTDDPAQDFLDRSYLTYVVPAESGLDLRQFLSQDGPSTATIDSLEQRESLFFGMPVTDAAFNTNAMS